MADRTYNGFVYRQAAPGQPWVKVGPATMGEPDPIKVAGAKKAQNEAEASVYDPRIAASEADLKAAQAAKARAETKELGGLDKQKLANIRATQAQIDRLHHLYRRGPGRTKGFASLADYLPTERNKRFDTAGAGLGEVGLAAFRVPGVGSQSDTELKAFIDANRPSSWDNDGQILEKLNNLQSRLNQTYEAYGMKRQGGAATGGGWKIERLDD